MAIPLIAGISHLVQSIVYFVVRRFASTVTTLTVMSVLAKILSYWVVTILIPIALLGLILYLLQLIVPYVFSLLASSLSPYIPETALYFTGPIAYMLGQFQAPLMFSMLATAAFLRFFLRLIRVI